MRVAWTTEGLQLRKIIDRRRIEVILELMLRNRDSHSPHRLNRIESVALVGSRHDRMSVIGLKECVKYRGGHEFFTFPWNARAVVTTKRTVVEFRAIPGLRGCGYANMGTLLVHTCTNEYNKAIRIRSSRCARH